MMTQAATNECKRFAVTCDDDDDDSNEGGGGGGGGGGGDNLTEVVICGDVLSAKQHVIYFGGDVQDYPEEMQCHRDNQQYGRWNLEETARILRWKFSPSDTFVMVVRPARLNHGTFSVFSNFVVSDDYGVPSHSVGQRSWTRLGTLYRNVLRKVLPPATERGGGGGGCEGVGGGGRGREGGGERERQGKNFSARYSDSTHPSDSTHLPGPTHINDPTHIPDPTHLTEPTHIQGPTHLHGPSPIHVPASSPLHPNPDPHPNLHPNPDPHPNLHPDPASDVPVSIVGFSKGCVVLNQLTHDLTMDQHGANARPETRNFIRSVRTLYWLDGAHSGRPEKTWVTNTEILQDLAQSGIKVSVHVTPYQMEDASRRWIRHEEKDFVGNLRKFHAKVKEKLYFASLPRSIENHFLLLEEFN
ncbi:hypothetical protein Ahia01_000842900, partial [Argonauta hians]